METLYTPAEVAAIVGCSKPALRSYTATYSAYYSGSATPGIGQTRQYTENDIKLTSFIYSRSATGHTHQDTLKALADGELDNYAFTTPERPTEAPDGPGDSQGTSTAIVPAERLHAALTLLQDAQRREQQAQEAERAAQTRINALERELGTALGKLAQRRRPNWWVAIFGGE